MSYATLIGWRYLYQGRSTTIANAGGLGSLALIAVGLGLFLIPGRPSPFGVALLGIGMILRLFSVFTTVTITGIVLGSASLLIVLSVLSGFQRTIRDKVLGVNAHVIVMKAVPRFANYRDIEDRVRDLGPRVLAEQPFVLNEMLITRGRGELAGIALKGVDPARVGSVLDLPQHIEKGNLADLAWDGDPSRPPPVMIGRELARKLKAKLGDDVALVLPNLRALQGDRGDQELSRKRTFRITGIFYSGFDEYDRRLVYTDIRAAQDFLGDGDVVMGVEMRLRSVEDATAIGSQLEHQLGEPYVVTDWRELNNNLFTALTIQKTAFTIFLALIIIVAAFTLVASLTMLTIDRTRAIAILKSMGASGFGVAFIFQVVGIVIGLIGTALGLLLGLLLCTLVSRYGYELDPRVYLIDRLPVEVNPLEVLLVLGITMLFAILATIYPAVRAARLRPAIGLRYE